MLDVPCSNILKSTNLTIASVDTILLIILYLLGNEVSVMDEKRINHLAEQLVPAHGTPDLPNLLDDILENVPASAKFLGRVDLS